MWWMTAHLFVKTYYAPLLARPLDFLHGLRAVFGAWLAMDIACSNTVALTPLAPLKDFSSLVSSVQDVMK
jgi:hypothetical protein